MREFPVAEKRRYTVSLPEHIAKDITERCAWLGSKDAEYIAGIVRWWYGQGSPPINDEERRLIGALPPPKPRRNQAS
jgi:hypothetical protein